MTSQSLLSLSHILIQFCLCQCPSHSIFTKIPNTALLVLRSSLPPCLSICSMFRQVNRRKHVPLPLALSAFMPQTFHTCPHKSKGSTFPPKFLHCLPHLSLLFPNMPTLCHTQSQLFSFPLSGSIILTALHLPLPPRYIHIHMPTHTYTPKCSFLQGLPASRFLSPNLNKGTQNTSISRNRFIHPHFLIT